MLNRMERHTGKVYDDVTADAGYESEENYILLVQVSAFKRLNRRVPNDTHGGVGGRIVN